MYLASKGCRWCRGTGTVERARMCCGPVSPYGKDCDCDASGYVITEEPCECTRLVRKAKVAYRWCPRCEGWGQYATVTTVEVESPRRIVWETDAAHCDACRGTGWKRIA